MAECGEQIALSSHSQAHQPIKGIPSPAQRNTGGRWEPESRTLRVEHLPWVLPGPFQNRLSPSV